MFPVSSLSLTKNGLETDMLVKEALAFGKVSTGNSKMPGTTFAMDSFACITGSKLRKIEGTPCHSCYAIRLQKLRPSVDKGWKANSAKWTSAEPDRWSQAMAFLIKRRNTDGHHRWFDGGDLASVEQLEAIVQVSLMTPEVKHWLPTQERGMVKQYLASGGTFPSNLVVRISSAKIDTALKGHANTSNVITKHTAATGQECLAYTRKNNCGDCRACWNPDVSNVSYRKH
jgi:hypothetical protein